MSSRFPALEARVSMLELESVLRQQRLELQISFELGEYHLTLTPKGAPSHTFCDARLSNTISAAFQYINGGQINVS